MWCSIGRFAVAAALLALPSLGRAATVATTAPFLGTEFLSGRVRCLAVNVDDKPRTLTRMELVSTTGQVLHALPSPTLVPPGQIQLTDFSALLLENPAFC